MRGRQDQQGVTIMKRNMPVVYPTSFDAPTTSEQEMDLVTRRDDAHSTLGALIAITLLTL